MNREISHLHAPVLFDEVRECFSTLSTPPRLVIDATLGLGGHSSALVKMMGGGDWIGIDRDSENLERARKIITNEELRITNTKTFDNFAQKTQDPHLHFIHASFADLDSVLEQVTLTKRGADGVYSGPLPKIGGGKETTHPLNPPILGGESNQETHIPPHGEGSGEIDFILYDLGVSSVHFDQADRGFSFRSDAPLDMRFDRTTGPTAADIVNTYEMRDLRRIFTDYGEDPKAHFIALALEESRKKKRIETTGELTEIIESSSYDKKSTLRIFQALRIEVNDEFGHIRKSLESAMARLSVGGRIAVITFHSLEDRLVKNIFAPHLKAVIDEVTGRDLIPARLMKVTKKPLEPSREEIERNPRSRSAKLRVVERVY